MTAAVPLAALSARQGLFDPALRRATGVIHGAAGGVGHFATQLARWRGVYVDRHRIELSQEDVRGLAQTRGSTGRAHAKDVGGVDLVFDTVGGEPLRRSRP
jgi:NADPH:quinone reductase-like Zn-dependent oxidoreductase